MCNFLLWWRLNAYTAYTGAANAAAWLQLFKRKCRSTAASLFFLIRCIFSRKNTYLECIRRSSVGTSPNFAQENDDLREGSEISPVNDELIPYVPENHDANTYSEDEFDHEDYDEWWEDHYEEYDDDRYDDILRKSWQQEAVDEAIDEEEPGQYPKGDIPF